MTTVPKTREQQIGERFAADTTHHKLVVLHDDGLYRHLRFAHPERGAYWFDLITWPGTLAFRGDMDGGYMFSRVRDMFEFFRSDRGDINPHYWGEKLEGGRRSVQHYDEDVLKGHVHQLLDDAAERAKDEADEDLHAAVGKGRAMLNCAIDDGDTSHERGARQLLDELEELGLTSDSWETSLHDYDMSFLWACHAIVWGIGQYDAAKSVTTAGGAT